MINKHYKKIKTALRKKKYIDYYFPCLYGYSPYVGCEHGCIYCDGRCEKYYVEGIFDKDITIRKNLVEIIEKEIPKKRERGLILIGSGVSDPYQPVEIQEKLMRRSLEVIEPYGFPVGILTKSALVLRDLDILKRINGKAQSTIMVSLTFTNDEQRKLIEPHASSVEARFNIIKEAKAVGLTAGVLAMPLLPCINDHESNVSELLRRGKEAGADFVMPAGLTLRPGIQKEGYFQMIRQHYPECLSTYEWAYSENRQSGAPLQAYSNKTYPLINKWMKELKISPLLPFETLRKQMPLYRSIGVLLLTMASLYKQRGVSVDRLKKANKKYLKWIDEKITYYNRRRTLAYETLEAEVYRVIEDGSINEIIQNKKLSQFLYEIICEDKTFDYVDLKVK